MQWILRFFSRRSITRIHSSNTLFHIFLQHLPFLTTREAAWYIITRASVCIYNVSQKVAPLKLFCNIFGQAKYISMKICHYVASTHTCRFRLIYLNI